MSCSPPVCLPSKLSVWSSVSLPKLKARIEKDEDTEQKLKAEWDDHKILADKSYKFRSQSVEASRKKGVEKNVVLGPDVEYCSVDGHQSLQCDMGGNLRCPLVRDNVSYFKRICAVFAYWICDAMTGPPSSPN